MYSPPATTRPSAVSRALARDRLGIPAVLAFILAGVAPLTVAAGLIPSAYATTGLTGIPAAFLVIAAILALFATGYMAMSRYITHAGAFYAFITSGLGRPLGVAAALMALLSYSYLQVALYGAFGPAAAGQAAAHLGLHASWWVWALAAWAVVSVLGLARVDITGKVLGTLTAIEIVVIAAETISGLASPAGGRLSFATLLPKALTTGGSGSFGVLAVVAVLGFTGFEQAPVLAEEARNPRRTIPVTTYLALGMIGILYAGSSWAMAARAGDRHVVAAAVAQGPGLLFGLGGGALSQTAQWLFLTSLFAAMLAFHNAVWRYAFALSREGVLPEFLSRTGANSVPKAASAVQSVIGLAIIAGYAITGAPPMQDLFFDLGTTGGFGILLLLALTSVAVIAFFARGAAGAGAGAAGARGAGARGAGARGVGGVGGARGENAWSRLIAPALAAVALTTIAVLAVQHYATLLGVPAGSPATWGLPAAYGVVAVAGLAWGLVLRARRPHVYDTIGLGAYAVTTAPGELS
jgi:amino acid transporter